MSLRPIEAQTMIQQVNSSQRDKIKREEERENKELTYKVNPIEEQEHKVQEKKKEENFLKQKIEVDDLDSKDKNIGNKEVDLKEDKIFFKGQNKEKIGNWIDKSI